MRIRDGMTPDPICCLATDSAQKVAAILRKQDVGSIPVVTDHESRKLIGIITDRDLCCSVVADGLDPQTTAIEKFVSVSPVVSCEGENLDHCERLMQEHQVRRIPIVDEDGRVMGIVSLADLALKDKPEDVARTVAEVSRRQPMAPVAAA